MSIEPDPRQVQELVESSLTGPVVMLNLLKFKPDGGEDGYMHYAEGAIPLIAKVGGRLLWQGRADSVVIGPSDEERWDAVALVEYPSRQAFLDMVTSPEYQSIGGRRTAALVDSRLIACTGALLDE